MPIVRAARRPATREVALSALAPVDLASLRRESLDRARTALEARPLGGRPVRIEYWPDRQAPVLADGRHRVLAAHELGLGSLPAILVGYGPRGGIRWTIQGTLVLDGWPAGTSAVELAPS
jgi:hypothetical protein